MSLAGPIVANTSAALACGPQAFANQFAIPIALTYALTEDLSATSPRAMIGTVFSSVVLDDSGIHQSREDGHAGYCHRSDNASFDERSASQSLRGRGLIHDFGNELQQLFIITHHHPARLF